MAAAPLAHGFNGVLSQWAGPGDKEQGSFPALYHPSPLVWGSSDGIPPPRFPPPRLSPLHTDIPQEKPRLTGLHVAYLLRNGLKVFPRCHRHDGAMGGLPQQRDAEKQELQ